VERVRLVTSPRTVDRSILLLLSRRDRLDDTRPPLSRRVPRFGTGEGVTRLGSSRARSSASRPVSNRAIPV
jgi:hypothetical protein